MAVKQYLFRLHHDLLESDGRDWSDVLDAPVQLTLNQCELHYTDFLCSLDENTADLSQQASMLAYAQSILTIHTHVWWIAVFELNDETGADQTTPVIVLHPYLEGAVGFPEGEWNEEGRYFRTWDFPGTAQEVNGQMNETTGNGFTSYQLYDGGRTTQSNFLQPDPWTVISIARDVTKGRYQLQMCKRCLSPEDYFFSQDDSMVLSMRGTLAATRFPLWQSVIESLPHGHSGYSVDSNGKLQGQPLALTRRVLNGVSNLAQQRRMFIRRDWAINTVTREWLITNKKFLAWFWLNDKYGWQTAEQITVIRPGGGGNTQLAFTALPWEYLSDNLAWVVDFLNLVNVAQGDTGLIITLPGTTEQQAQIEYEAVLEKLRAPDGAVKRYALREISDHIEIFRHMVDLVAFIMGALVDYRSALAEWQAIPYPPTYEQRLQHSQNYVDIQNNFALRWPGLVADFYSVFCLLQTWQLTWNVSERTRGEDGSDVLRNREPPYNKKWTRPFLVRKAQPILGAPAMTGDFATRRPNFVPFRTWDIAIYDSGFDALLAQEQQDQRNEAAQEWLEQLQQERTARNNAAAAARAQYLDEWRAERLARGLPNPDDVWDYRNFSSLEWWKQKSQEQLNVQFALRALNVPNELLSWSEFGLGVARNYIPALSRYSDENGWNESHRPADSPLERIAYSTVLILTRSSVPGGSGIVAFQIVGDVAGAVADYLGTDDETYSPRQFWPPIAFTW